MDLLVMDLLVMDLLVMDLLIMDLLIMDLLIMDLLIMDLLIMDLLIMDLLIMHLLIMDLLNASRLIWHDTEHGARAWSIVRGKISSSFPRPSRRLCFGPSHQSWPWLASTWT
ncbi:histidine-rich glycoprotein [Venturia nashicola]|uniref:Histidine-rich glycoprotein n=1 Tax=Venturia nashicola TaxID=86259 RepID=A0A4Z1NW04_9PEZI|nr:histidine-rich glycoprotein [Venturia nashicola]